MDELERLVQDLAVFARHMVAVLLAVIAVALLALLRWPL